MQPSQQPHEQPLTDSLHAAGVPDGIVEGLVEEDDEVLGALASLDSVDELLEIGRGPWHENGHYASMREYPDSAFAVSSQRIETGHGYVYVNIRLDDQGRPFMIKAHTGSSGGFTNSFVEALSGVISVALKSGVNPRYIVDYLTGIRGPKLGWDNGEEVASVPAAIGIALRRYLNDNVGEGRQSEYDGTVDCPECESPDVYITEGTKHCQTCGWDSESGVA